MDNPCRWEWLGDDWYPDWSDPPPPCAPGHHCSKPVGNGAFVGQTLVTNCVPNGPGEG